MSTSVNIRKAIVQGLVDAGFSYPIKWPNAPFETPVNTPWLRVSIMPGIPAEIGLQKTDRIDGILQIDVFVPVASGDVVAYGIADEIRQALPINGASFTSSGVKVQFRNIGVDGGGMAGESGSSQSGESWFRVMVTARFYSFVDRTL